MLTLYVDGISVEYGMIRKWRTSRWCSQLCGIYWHFWR